MAPEILQSDRLAEAAAHGAGDPVVAAATSQPQMQLTYNLELVQRMKSSMLAATSESHEALRSALPAELVNRILEDAFHVFKGEPTLLELSLAQPVEVIVVGDTHGQFHDVCKLLDLMGMPSESRTYIFNGDFVDRGAWGVELMVLLLLLKLACPTHMYLLRGNHESSTCTKFYGFKGEVDTKFSPVEPSAAPAAEVEEEAGALPGVAPTVQKPHPNAKAVYKAFKKVFSVLPLAALVQGRTLILHGGLFRHPTQSRKAGSKRRRLGCIHKLELGSLDDLRAASKGGLDPDGCGASVVAADVLWSDPVIEPGLQMNDARGVGLTFGPDVTQQFLEANSLSLVIRSHEGPDARSQRTDLPNILQGHSLDHVTPAGNLVTVFSAPDYPQFQESTIRYNNQGAVAVLTAPDYCKPDFRSFDAALPRPPARAFYDYLAYADTDEEVGSEDEHGSELGISSASLGPEHIDNDDQAVQSSAAADGASALGTDGASGGSATTQAAAGDSAGAGCGSVSHQAADKAVAGGVEGIVHAGGPAMSVGAGVLINGA